MLSSLSERLADAGHTPTEEYLEMISKLGEDVEQAFVGYQVRSDLSPIGPTAAEALDRSRNRLMFTSRTVY